MIKGNFLHAKCFILFVCIYIYYQCQVIYNLIALSAGFSYYGTETFYSGMSGEELTADIFCGSLYYLRLYHIAEEKFQVQKFS